eukprot:2642936-Amphidinium_carterae.1
MDQAGALYIADKGNERHADLEWTMVHILWAEPWICARLVEFIACRSRSLYSLFVLTQSVDVACQLAAPEFHLWLMAYGTIVFHIRIVYESCAVKRNPQVHYSLGIVPVPKGPNTKQDNKDIESKDEQHQAENTTNQLAGIFETKTK